MVVYLYSLYGGMEVVEPFFFKDRPDLYNHWLSSCQAAEESYQKLIQAGAKPQEARSVLPNSLKTEIVVTANIREWRHIFLLRCDKPAHPQIRQIMIPLLKHLSFEVGELFNDLLGKISIDDFPAEHYAEVVVEG